MTILCYETVVCSDDSLDFVAKTFTCFDKGDPEHVGHHVARRLLADLIVFWGRPLVSHSTTPHAYIQVQRVEVGGAGRLSFRESVAGDVVGNPVLRHLGLVGMGRVLLEHNHIHPGLQRVPQYLDAFAGFSLRPLWKI